MSSGSETSCHLMKRCLFAPTPDIRRANVGTHTLKGTRRNDNTAFF